MLKNEGYSESLWMLAISNIKKYPNIRKQFLTNLRKMSLFPENTCLRCFLNNSEPNKESFVNNHSISFDYSVPDKVKSINTQKIISDFLGNYAQFITLAASYDVSEADDTLKFKYTDIYDKLKAGTILARQYFN